MICILMVEITTQKILMIKAKAVNNGCLFLCLEDRKTSWYTRLCHVDMLLGNPDKERIDN